MLHVDEIVAHNPRSKWMTCLGCGRPMWTDSAHRICKKCQRKYENVFVKTRYKIGVSNVRPDSDSDLGGMLNLFGE